MTKNLFAPTAMTVASLLLPVAANGQDVVKLAAESAQNWNLCATWENWVLANPADAEGGVAGCPLQGDCDNASVRDTYIPNSSTPIKTIRLRFHVFANTDGGNPASSLTEVAQQVAKLNADYLVWRIQFVHTAEIINDSTYRDFTPNVEDSAMKNLYADSPATQLNVYVVNTTCCYAGLGTFPWDPNSLTNAGGIIIDDSYFDATNEVLTHEVGHCIGLWHTHHGVSEVGTCSDCYESPPGNNTSGDFCSDTHPTPTEANGDCDGYGGTDPCSGQAWSSQPQNYMGYAGPACWDTFTSQQAGRMHCWITAKLTGWLETPPPPCPGVGSCFAAHGTPGCDNTACCEAICQADPFCCDNQWDTICVDEANELCAGCGGVGTGSCFSAHGTPYCDRASCCDVVCSADSYCCNNQWDTICVNEANLYCASCGGSATGSCYETHAWGYCDNAACCDTVCAVDSYCCDSLWDSICVHEALDLCAVSVLAGPITYPTNGNQYYLLSVASATAAQAKAASMGGHLVTIANAAENEWVRANLANYGGTARKVWIGLGDVATEGTFVWVDGEPFAYSSWAPGEPNNSYDEDYVELYPTLGTWNDITKYSFSDNYAVAEIEVTICGDVGTLSCFETHGSPFCNDAACCTTVCNADPWCCANSWDSICVGEAFQMCYGCGAASAGSCYGAHSAPACNNASCCQTVCAADPFCCEVQWDSLCVNEAYSMCGPPPCPSDLNGDHAVNAADLAVLLGAWGTAGAADLDGSGIVNAGDLAILLGAWGLCP